MTSPKEKLSEEYQSPDSPNRSPLPGEACYLCLNGRMSTLAKKVDGGKPEVS
jgi:hypothetical protein